MDLHHFAVRGPSGFYGPCNRCAWVDLRRPATQARRKLRLTWTWTRFWREAILTGGLVISLPPGAEKFAPLGPEELG